jgi:hypothetical protein
MIRLNIYICVVSDLEKRPYHFAFEKTNEDMKNYLYFAKRCRKGTIVVNKKKTDSLELEAYFLQLKGTLCLHKNA